MIDKKARQRGSRHTLTALNHERNISKYNPAQSTWPICIWSQAEFEDFRALRGTSQLGWSTTCTRIIQLEAVQAVSARYVTSVLKLQSCKPQQRT